MGSAVTSSPTRRPSIPLTEGLRLVGVSWRVHAWRVLLFSLPFLAFSLWTSRLDFVSNAHAHLTAKALLAIDRLRLEVIGFLYPPLPFLLVLPAPRVWMPSLLASLAAGATVWLLWYDLERTGLPRIARMLIVASVAASPMYLFLASQSFPDILALHLVVVAWHYYINFVRSGHTFSGFVAGMVLGLAFYANFFTLFYALTFAALVPLYRSEQTGVASDRALWAAVSQAFVTAFPALWAVASWTYVNWVFTGNPLTYLADPAAAVIDRTRIGVPWSERPAWIAEYSRELVLQPFLWGSLVLNAWLRPRRTVPLVIVAMLPSLIRVLGLSYSVPLALGTYAVLALLALPERIPRWVTPMLVVLAALQVVASATLLRDAGEVRKWEDTVVMGQSHPQDTEETAFARALRAAPPYSILADDRSAYRLIARAGSARPFLLPADPSFSQALETPDRLVRYVLVSADPAEGDMVSSRFSEGTPSAFVVDGFWGDWTLYRRVDASSLLSSR